MVAKRSTRFAFVLLAVLAACAVGSSSIIADRSQLRSRNEGLFRTRIGVCTASSPGLTGVIETCLQQGMPGFLRDDGKTIHVVTKVVGPANSPSADTGNWQIEILRDGTLLQKEMMQRNWPPTLDCSGLSGSPCGSYSIDVRQIAELPAGTYTFRYTSAFDTGRTTTNTITITDRP